MTFDNERARRSLAAVAERYARAPGARWSPVPPELDRAMADDRELAAAGLLARRHLVHEATYRLAGLLAHQDVARYEHALLMVPRERFVLPEDIACSANDSPTPLDREGLATVSAPHAYLLTYGCLGLQEGDHLVELGTGTGYGAALASYVVGPRGRVTSVEIDPVLEERARRLLAEPGVRGDGPVKVIRGDGRTMGPEIVARAGAEGGAVRVAVTYAVESAPEELLAALPEGGRAVVPVGTNEAGQLLVRWVREGGELRRSIHGAVRYVAERS